LEKISLKGEMMRTRVHLHITAAVTHSSSIPLIFFFFLLFIHTHTQETLFLHGVWGLSAPSGSIIPCSNTGGEKEKIKKIKKKERKNNFQK
jgi:hypothetical protein